MAKRVAAIGISRSRFGVCSDNTIQELAFEAIKGYSKRCCSRRWNIGRFNLRYTLLTIME